MKIAKLFILCSSVVLLGDQLSSATAVPQSSGQQVAAQLTYLVQAETATAAASAVKTVSGQIISQLEVIDAVAARLDPAQVDRLRKAGLRLHENRQMKLAGDLSEGSAEGKNSIADYVAWIQADRLHAEGIDGSGVTVAFLDTGVWEKVAKKAEFLAWADTSGDATGEENLDGNAWKNVSDENGHGSHVASVVTGNRNEPSGKVKGVAPGARLVMVRAFDAEGSGSYLDVVEGIDWVVRNKAALGIDVLNLSFGAEPISYYWEDPVNQAVMAAWAAGIVVVASAGNTGPEPMTIGVPGNVPYVITVGAAGDGLTPTDASDDHLSHFSSTGPTIEGFVKPELIAPGEYILARMDPDSSIANEHYQNPTDEEKALPETYYRMSGTSQSAAIVSGAVALMLQAEPGLRPDEVKCRLMSSARAAMRSAESPLFSIFQQGAGLIDAYAAVYSQANACANIGLDVNAELRSEAHFGGLAAFDENSGEYFLRDPSDSSGNSRIEAEAYTWDGQYSFSQGYTWGGHNMMSQGYTWGGHNSFSQGYTWGGHNITMNGYTWGGHNGVSLGYTWGGHNGVSLGYTWGGHNGTISGYTWGGHNVAVTGTAEQSSQPDTSISINRWVEPEPRP